MTLVSILLLKTTIISGLLPQEARVEYKHARDACKRVGRDVVSDVVNIPEEGTYWTGLAYVDEDVGVVHTRSGQEGVACSVEGIAVGEMRRGSRLVYADGVLRSAKIGEQASPSCTTYGHPQRTSETLGIALPAFTPIVTIESPNTTKHSIADPFPLSLFSYYPSFLDELHPIFQGLLYYTTGDLTLVHPASEALPGSNINPVDPNCFRSSNPTGMALGTDVDFTIVVKFRSDIPPLLFLQTVPIMSSYTDASATNGPGWALFSRRSLLGSRKLVMTVSGLECVVDDTWLPPTGVFATIAVVVDRAGSITMYHEDGRREKCDHAPPAPATDAPDTAVPATAAPLAPVPVPPYTAVPSTAEPTAVPAPGSITENLQGDWFSVGCDTSSGGSDHFPEFQLAALWRRKLSEQELSSVLQGGTAYPTYPAGSFTDISNLLWMGATEGSSFVIPPSLPTTADWMGVTSQWATGPDPLVAGPSSAVCDFDMSVNMSATPTVELTFDIPTAVFLVEIFKGAPVECISKLRFCSASSVCSDHDMTTGGDTTSCIVTARVLDPNFAVSTIGIETTGAEGCTLDAVRVEGFTRGSVSRIHAKGLIGWWKFDSSLDDESVNGLTGTTSPAAKYTPGQVGNALDLDNTYTVQVGPLPVAFTTPSFTLCVWARGAGEIFATSIFALATAPGSLSFIVSGSQVTSTWDITAPTHVCAVLATKELHLYVGGALQNSSVVTYPALLDPTTTGNVSIGDGFVGSLDEIRLYNMPLSAEAVLDLNTNNRQNTAQELSPVWHPNVTYSSGTSLATDHMAWCVKVTGVPPSQTCNAQGVANKTGWLPTYQANRVGYGHLAVESDIGQAVQLEWAAEQLDLWVNGVAVSLGAPPDVSGCQMWDKWSYIPKQFVISATCRKTTSTFNLKDGWNTLLFKVTSLTSKGLYMSINPASDVLWSYVKPLEGVLNPNAVDVTVTASCGDPDYGVPSNTHTVQMAANATILFNETCSDVEVQLDVVDPPGPSQTFGPFLLYILATQLSVTAPTSIHTQQLFRVAIEATDAAGRVDVSQDTEVTATITASYMWGHLLSQHAIPSTVAASMNFVKGKLQWEDIYFPIPGIAILTFNSASFPPVSITVNVTHHPCDTPQYCGVGSTCTPEFGCLCPQDVEQYGYWDRAQNCKTCIEGYAGPDCTIVCPGMPHGKICGHGTCDIGSGLCVCTDDDTNGHWKGAGCNECKDGYYGIGCVFACPTCGTNGVCNGGVAGNGMCMCTVVNADPSDCVTCTSGYTGSQCQLKCPDACNSRGTCADNSGILICTCDVGWGGDSCNIQCPQTNGTICGGHGTCQPSGECNCSTNFVGIECTECVYGKTNQNCSQDCRAMTLVANKMMPCSGHGVCQLDNTCTCVAHYSGLDCDILCPGYSGDPLPCSGHGICNLGGTCDCYDDDTNGHWDGTHCDQCIANSTREWVGSACDRECPNPMNSVCSGHGTCVLQPNPYCLCDYTFCQSQSCQGTCAAACQDWEWGQTCSPCPCSKGDGVCDLNSGKCYCNSGKFGSDCSSTCNPPCVNGMCIDGPNGPACKCHTGYSGADCTGTCGGVLPLDDVCGRDPRKCTQPGSCDCGLFVTERKMTGPNCDIECDGDLGGGSGCSGHGTCGADGSCTCYANWQGTGCGGCVPGKSAPGCTGTCVNGVTSGEICSCSPGWAGDSCDVPCNGTYVNNSCVCASGTWGSNCSLPCNPCTHGTGDCNQLTGNCICKPFYAGDTCEKCIPGRKFVDGTCTEVCCSGHGECNANNACKCLESVTQGYWAGTICERCKEGYRGVECKDRNLLATQLPQAKCKGIGCPVGNWSVGTPIPPVIHTLDPVNNAVIAGGYPLYTVLNGDSSPKQLPIPAVCPGDPGPVLFLHIFEGVMYTVVSCVGKPEPILAKCNWVDVGGEGRPQGCNTDSSNTFPGNEAFESGVGVGHRLFLAFQTTVHVAEQGVKVATTIVHPFSIIYSVGFLGGNLLIGGKTSVGWDVIVAKVDTPTLPAAITAWSVRDLAPIYADQETGHMVCGTTVREWFQGQNCTQNSDYSYAAFIVTYSTTALIALQGDYDNVALLRVDMQTNLMRSIAIVNNVLPGRIRGMTVDEPGDQAFLSFVPDSRPEGSLYRVQLSNLLIRGVTQIAEGNQLLYSMLVQNSERLLWAIASLMDVVLVPFLLHATDRITPYLSHVQGGTRLAVTGIGFVGEEAPLCKIGNSTVPATIYNSTEVLCVTEPSASCVFEDVSLSLRDNKYAHDPFLKVRRVAMPVITAVIDDMTPKVLGTDINVQGKGFIPSEFAKCSYSYITNSSRTSPASIIATPNGLMCQNPITSPKGISVSLDGHVFSEEFLFQRDPTLIVTNTTSVNTTMTIRSAERSMLDPITVEMADEHLNLAKMRDPVNHTVAIELTGQGVGVGSPLKAEDSCLDPVTGKPTMGTVDGVASFCDMWFEKPLKGVAYLRVYDVAGVLENATVIVVVDPGLPHSLSPPVLSSSELAEGDTISSSLNVLDIAGNVVSDGGRVSARFVQEAGAYYEAVEPTTDYAPIAEFITYEGLNVVPMVAYTAAAIADNDTTTTWTCTPQGVVLGSASGNPFFLDNYVIKVSPTTSLLRWTLEGSEDNTTWFDVDDKTVYDTNDTLQIQYDPVGTAVTYLRLKVVKGVDRGQVGTNEDGTYTFGDMSLTSMLHEAKYRIRYLCEGLNVSTADSNVLMTPLCKSRNAVDYYQPEGTGRCDPCPANAQCNGTSIVIAKDGYWRYSNLTMSFYECPLKETCKPTSCSDNSQGVLCADCKLGWGRDFLERQCTKCGGYVIYSIVFGPLVCAMILVGWMVAHIFQVGVFIQVLGRILIDHSQLLSSLAHVELSFPHNLRTFFKTMSVLSLDMKNYQEFDCYMREQDFTSLDFFLVSMAIPLVALPIAAVVWVIHAVWVKRKSRTFSGRVLSERERYLHDLSPGADQPHDGWIDQVEDVQYSKKGLVKTTTVQILLMTCSSVVYLLYAMLVRKAADVLDCIEVESIAPCEANSTELPVGCIIGGETVNYLKSDPQIECDGSYSKYKAVAILFLVVYTVVVPAALFTGVKVYRSWYGNDVAAMAFPFFSGGYRALFSGWGIVVLLRKYITVLIIVFARDVNLRAYLLTWLVIIVAMLQVIVQPFTNTTHNMLEGLCLLVLVLDLNLGLFFLIEEDENLEYKEVLSVVTLVLNILLVVCIVGAMLKKLVDICIAKNKAKNKSSKWEMVSKEFGVQLLEMEPGELPEDVEEDNTAPPLTEMRYGGNAEVVVAMGVDCVMLGDHVIQLENLINADADGKDLVLNTAGGLVVLQSGSALTASSWAAYLMRRIEVQRPLVTLPPVLLEAPLDEGVKPQEDKPSSSFEDSLENFSSAPLTTLPSTVTVNGSEEGQKQSPLLPPKLHESEGSHATATDRDEILS
eukprot:TRINITY_DN3209_c0_g5_i1.p1 TRINITY_DN3209_c0_g5~~TRINITY_DN3209_c0_g5_i1.p1  ORF type:complete len:3437 (+),score=632.31 TRINITY_DN3209_c0_g5_i1:58-10311(+)